MSDETKKDETAKDAQPEQAAASEPTYTRAQVRREVKRQVDRGLTRKATRRLLYTLLRLRTDRLLAVSEAQGLDTNHLILTAVGADEVMAVRDWVNDLVADAVDAFAPDDGGDDDDGSDDD